MFRKFAVGLVVVLMCFSLLIVTRPPVFHVQRSMVVSAPPETLFAHVNDFQKWRAWSPYENLDPNMKRTYEGSLSGEGAAYTWVGNDKAGEGKMKIAKSDKNKEIDIDIDFKKPMSASNKIKFSFEPVPEGTKVTWAMDGNNNFFSKAFQLFVDFDKMVGDDFEKGLASLKEVAEKEAQKPEAEKKPESPEKKPEPEKKPAEPEKKATPPEKKPEPEKKPAEPEKKATLPEKKPEPEKKPDAPEKK